MTDLVIVSMHENGFPQADLYHDAGSIDASEFERLGLSPDGFFTMKRGDTLEATWRKAREKWPDAKIVEGESDDEDDDD